MGLSPAGVRDALRGAPGRLTQEPKPVPNPARTTHSLASSHRSASRAAGAIAALAGFLVPLGWAFDLTRFEGVMPGLSAMKANTALALLMAGVALWLLQASPDARELLRIGRGCALAVALMGALTLVEYLCGWNLGIDQLLFRDAAGAPEALAPGRMAPNTALSFILLGAALLLLYRGLKIHLAHYLALAAALIAFMAFIGYLYGAEALCGFASDTRMAGHTALTLIILSVGILFARPEQGMMKAVVSDAAGGVMARRLLPAALLLPVALGWLRLAGERAGHYDMRFGLSLMVLSTTVTLGALVWSNAGRLYRMEAKRRGAEVSVLESARETESLYNGAPCGYHSLDKDGTFVRINDTELAWLGYARDEMIGRMKMSDLVAPGSLPTFQEAYALLQERGWVRGVELEICRKDGTVMPVLINATSLRDGTGVHTGCRATIFDISAHKELEEQLRQSQKMEAVGRLAGGVAHDFNNLLTAILGYSEIVLAALDPDDPRRNDVAEIEKAGRRAAALTDQLLAFSRRQVRQPKVLALNTVISDLEKMLRRLIGEDIDLKTHLRPELWNVKADPGQIEQIIMNLVVNARDAMPKGGRLTIETANAELDAAYGSLHVSTRPGPYVMLAVSDTGVGMDRSIQARIFEPFFTTKEPGKGSGLGLSTVYGIVKQNGGNIWVYSEPGKGATFKIYLPRTAEVAEREESRPVRAEASQGSETVLVVEDEIVVRSLARQILEMNGYGVLEATDAGEALSLCERHTGPIHLLLTDVVLPRDSGRELARQLTPKRPETKVLFMSGYTDDAIVHHGVLDDDAPFLQKPFTADGLARKVHEVLDQS